MPRKPRAPVTAAPDPGDENRRKAAERSRIRSRDARDIGELPACENPSRRASCLTDLALFLQTYFPATFTLPFCADHRQSIAKIQACADDGGLFALAEPRGSGKTSRVEGAAIFAALKGVRKFIVPIGATADAAVGILDSIKTELETNELLLADFPEAVYPIRCLEGEPRRCKGQTYQGKQTRSQWSSRLIVFPTIPGSSASGVIIRVAGITGSVRGMKYKRPDGKTARPDFVVLDDIQTDASARSESQCRNRMSTIAGAVLGLAGPGKKIACVAPITIIRKDDVADKLLDPTISPDWNGSRFKMVYAFPSNTDLWNQYREILISFNPAELGAKERAAAAATEFYREHRAEMDAGAIISWPERKNPDELSAIQHAMNLKFRDERAFFAEFQNEPMQDCAGDFEELTAVQIANKINRVERRVVPVGRSRLTAFVDVQGKLLYYVVCAWSDGFAGDIIDYGTWPDQHRAYFTLADAQRTLATETKKDGLEAQIYAGLTALVTTLFGRDWRTADDGAALRIERCLIDSGWGDSTPVVFQFCRQSAFAALLTPSKGVGITASSKPLSERTRKEGERLGLEWYMPLARETRGVRSVQYDTNFWKSHVHGRLRVDQGAPAGCLSLFGVSAQVHQMFADHLTSEYRVRTEGRGRTVDVWERIPNRENHWLDCLVGCAVGASMQGVGLEGVHASTIQTRPKALTLAEMKRAATGR